MTALVLPLMARTSAAWNVVVQAITDLSAGIQEGCETAARYDVLAHKTDSELRTLGIERENIPATAMFGSHR
jgi:hypothetical protein